MTAGVPTLGGRPAPPPALIRYRIVDEAESRLRSLGRYRDVHCSVVEPPVGGVLACRVQKARVVRDITVTGLALGLLEADVRHRLSLRSGDAIDAIDDDGDEAAPAQLTGPTSSPGSTEGNEPAAKNDAQLTGPTSSPGSTEGDEPLRGDEGFHRRIVAGPVWRKMHGNDASKRPVEDIVGALVFSGKLRAIAELRSGRTAEAHIQRG